MKKLLLPFATLYFCSVSFAFESSEGVKILDTKIECKGFKECGMDFFTHLKKVAQVFNEVNAWVPELRSFKKGDAYLIGYHDIYIHNKTNVEQIYEYSYTRACEKMTHIYMAHVLIPPGGHFSEQTHTRGKITGLGTGSYRTYVSTIIIGVSDSEAQDSSLLTVVK